MRHYTLSLVIGIRYRNNYVLARRQDQLSTGLTPRPADTPLEEGNNVTVPNFLQKTKGFFWHEWTYIAMVS